MANRIPTIDVLLNLVPDAPASVLTQLHAHPELASQQDQFGYSLVHAAASYEQRDLLKALIEEFKVDPNILDQDGENCLFNAESVAMATELINFGVNASLKNSDGLTAAEKLDDEDEQPAVAAYLRNLSSSGGTASSSTIAPHEAVTNTNGTSATADADSVRPPPPIPNGVQVSVGTMHADEVGDEPDPEFRRRIEELAARQDFEGEESQNELRDLISDAVSGMSSGGQPPATRRRIG